MARIVFASCMTTERDREQAVWKQAAAHKPEWLILLGDNIYIDCWPNMYQSKYWDPARFAVEMEKRYAEQFEVPAFQALIKSIPANQVLGVWDDHDFAWENCFGTDPNFGMPVKKKIATAMYRHYFAALNQRPLPAKLPKLEIPDPLNPPGGERDIYRACIIGPLRVLLCDGRSYREDITSGNSTASLLGDVQEKWLFSELAKGSGPYLLVSGSTMTNGRDQSWDVYREFFKERFLPAVRGKTVIFLGGDRHINDFPSRVSDGPMEVVSSGAALRTDGERFGVMDVSAER